jgi:hypothetical protein
MRKNIAVVGIRYLLGALVAARAADSGNLE